MSKVLKLSNELAAVRKRLASVQQKVADLARRSQALEVEYGNASADEDTTAAERLDAELTANAEAQRRAILTAEGLERKIAPLEAQLRQAADRERARATERVAKREAEIVSRTKATLQALMGDVEELEAVWRELNAIAGGSRRAADAVTTALCLALHRTLPALRDHIVMHPNRAADPFAGFDLYSASFRARSKRASAPGSTVLDDAAAVAEARSQGGALIESPLRDAAERALSTGVES